VIVKKGEMLYNKAIEQNDIAYRIKLLEESVSQCADFNGYYELAKAYEAVDKLDKAENALVEARNIAVSDEAAASALSRLGLVYEKTGNREHEAYIAFRQSYEYHPYPKVLERIKVYDLKRLENGTSAKEIKMALSSNTKDIKVEPYLSLYIRFDFDSAQLTREGTWQANELGRALTAPEFKNSLFLLAGHTDSQGDDKYNQQLSEKRAEAVKNYLIRHNSLNTDTILTKGYGERRRIYPGNTELDHALNRRVEVRILSCCEYSK